MNSTEIRVTLRTCENGKAFEGFKSGKVYFGGDMSQVGGQSLLRITKVNNQTMGMLLADDINKPEIAVQGAYKLVINPGDKEDEWYPLECLQLIHQTYHNRTSYILLMGLSVHMPVNQYLDEADPYHQYDPSTYGQ